MLKKCLDLRLFKFFWHSLVNTGMSVCAVLLPFSPEAGGWWNTKGCEVVSRQYGYTVCDCNHTTNFALLLQLYETQVTFLPFKKKKICIDWNPQYVQLFTACVCAFVCVSEERGERKSTAGADVYWLWSVSVWPPLHLHPLYCCRVSHKRHRVYSVKLWGWKAFHKKNPATFTSINEKKTEL